LSGTGSQGATIRLYVEKFDQEHHDLESQTAIQDLVSIALEISELKAFTGREEPTVIT
jgi:phosphoglucomutase